MLVMAVSENTPLTQFRAGVVRPCDSGICAAGLLKNQERVEPSLGYKDLTTAGKPTAEWDELCRSGLGHEDGRRDQTAGYRVKQQGCDRGADPVQGWNPAEDTDYNCQQCSSDRLQRFQPGFAHPEERKTRPTHAQLAESQTLLVAVFTPARYWFRNLQLSHDQRELRLAGLPQS
jgi:hypothetical protein